MSSEAEELKIEIRERFEDAYRLPVNAQISLYIFLELVVIGVLYNFYSGNLVEAFLIFLFVSSVLYPVIIKVRNFYTELIALSLYGATIFSVALYIFELLLMTEGGTSNPNVWMAIIFLLIFGVELFHHMYEKARVLKTKWVYIVDLVLSIFFFYAAYNLFSLIGADIMWTLVLSSISTLMFFFAIKPEAPF